jgi:NAD+ synthase
LSTSKLLHPTDIPDEIERLVSLIRTDVRPEESAFVLISGGLDSDVVARLAAAALTAARLKLATVIQDDMNLTHLANARQLASELDVSLVEIDLRGVNLDALYRLAAADRVEDFNPLGLLDPARMKCSVRTAVVSSYQDRGYIILGTSNRTESQLGFFLPFGDGVWHVGPIAHLYKTEVRLLAAELGTAEAVCSQAPSAGFWSDQTDREDLGFWLVNRGPIQRERNFSDEEVNQAAEFSDRLVEADIDQLLLAIADGTDPASVPPGAKLGPDLVKAVVAIVDRSARLKTRPTGVTLARRT